MCGLSAVSPNVVVSFWAILLDSSVSVDTFNNLGYLVVSSPLTCLNLH